MSCPRLDEGVQHAIGELRGCEHLVVGEVRDACQHLWIAAAEREACLTRHTGSFGASASAAAASSPTVVGGYVWTGVKISCLRKLAQSVPSSDQAAL